MPIEERSTGILTLSMFVDAYTRYIVGAYFGPSTDIMNALRKSIPPEIDSKQDIPNDNSDDENGPTADQTDG